MKKFNLVGQKFGMLTVVEPALSQNHRAMWVCACECGSQSTVYADNLKSGKTKSCSCMEGLGLSPEDLTSQRFGRLVVHKLVSHKPPMWECVCDCGNTVRTRANSLKMGTSQSCGCLAAQSAHARFAKRPFEYLYNMLCRRAKRLHRVVDFSYEQFLTFTSVVECHYCDDVVMWYPFSSQSSRPINLDRKNNDLGYLWGNVAVTCIRCNKGKGKYFSYEEWVEVGKVLRAFRERKLKRKVGV